jgi:hypothetical protein
MVWPADPPPDCAQAQVTVKVESAAAKILFMIEFL